MSCHNTLLLSLPPNPKESQKENTCLFGLAMTKHCVKLLKQATRDVTKAHFQRKMLAAQHRHANVGKDRDGG